MAEEQLIKRLERLERDNWRMKIFCIGVLVLVGTLGAAHVVGRAPRTITAHALNLKDKSGRVRVRVGVSPQLGPQITLYDVDGHPGMQMGVYPRMDGEITFWDASERECIDILEDSSSAITPDGPRITLTNPLDREAARIQAYPMGGSEIDLSDNQNATRIDLFVDTQGRPNISLCNSHLLCNDLGSAPAAGER